MASGSFTVYRTGATDQYTSFLGWWTSTPDASTNTSTVEINLAAVRASGAGVPITGKVVTAVTVQANSNAGVMKSEAVTVQLNAGSQVQLFQKSFTVVHDANGDCEITVSITVSGTASPMLTGTGAFMDTLDHIDLPTALVVGVGSKTETSVTLNWSTLTAVDYLWYSTDNGSTWVANGSISGTSGAITITGLSANTAYDLKLKVRKAGSNLTTESANYLTTTYPYPYATSMPDFTIGNSVKIGLYNPLGRTVTVKLRAVGSDTNIATISTSGTSVTGFNGSNAVTALYATIPSAKSANYRIAITYGSHTETRTGGKYYVNESASKPTIGSVTYQDTNSLVVNVTGDNQIIVQNKSLMGVTATGLTAKNGASIASCSCSFANNLLNLTVSGSSATGTYGTLNVAVNATLTVTVVDSRGLTGSKSITVTVAGYTSPTAQITCFRHNNYYDETDITAKAIWSSIGGNTVFMRYTATEPTTMSEKTGVLADGVTSTVILANTYDWYIVVRVQDSFGGSTTYNIFLQKGVPIIFFDRDLYSVGVNCFPTHEKTFEIDGQVMNRNAITATFGGVQTSGISTQKITLTAGTTIGDQLTIDSGSVKIGAKITKVKVSAQLSILSPSAGSHNLSIYKNSSGISFAYAYRTLSSGSGTESMSVSDILIPVQSGDKLSIYVSGCASSEYLGGYLTVEAEG